MHKRHRGWPILELGLVAALCCAAGSASQPAPPTAPANPPATNVVAKPPVVNGGGGAAKVVEVHISDAKSATAGQLAQLEDVKAELSKDSKPPLATFKNVDEFLRPFIDDEGNLKINATALREIAARGPGQVKVEASSVDTAWTIVSPERAATRFFTLSRYDFNHKAQGEYWRLTLMITDDAHFSIQGQGILTFFQYNQTPTGVFLSQNAGWPTHMNVFQKGTSLLDLKEKYPNEVRQYLEPVLKQLCGRNLLCPGPIEFYTIFSDLAADPKVTAKVLDLLPQLDADAPDQRQAASAALAKLGRPGLLAVLRMDMTGLSIEQKARLRAFVNSFRQASIDDLESLRHDPHFLLDAMEDDDGQVRTEAKNQLQTLLGHTVNVDISVANEEARYKAMNQLRDDIEKELAAKGAATKPSQPDNAGNIPGPK